MNIQAEKAAALAIVDRMLAAGYHAKVYYEDGHPGCRFTGNRDTIAANLQATSLETVVFAAPPVRKGDKYARRGWVTFVWGNGEDVVSDYSDNTPTRKIMGTVRETADA